jgi:hypothetical protein
LAAGCAAASGWSQKMANGAGALEDFSEASQKMLNGFGLSSGWTVLSSTSDDSGGAKKVDIKKKIDSYETFAFRFNQKC